MSIIINNTTKEKINKIDIRKICNITFKKLGVDDALVSITIVDNNTLQEINKQYRKINKPTDVISFAFEEINDVKLDFRNLGEIYISIERAKEQSEEYGHSLKREICFLTVHGLLHLLGYDHINENDRIVMRKLEEEILSSYGTKR